MEQKTLEDKPMLRFVAVMAATWTIFILFVVLWLWAINKVQASNTQPAPIESVATQDYYQVATLHLTSNITGEAVISMDSFIVPVKFIYDSTVQRGETVIDIRSLEIGVITDISGQHKYSDFTNSDDHHSINTALVTYIKNNKLGDVL